MSSRIQSRSGFVLILLFTSILIFGGCSKEDLDKMVSDAKEKASSIQDSANKAIDKTKQTAAAVVDKDGSGNIRLDQETSFSSCFIRVIPADGSRPAILQIKSDRDDQEKLPSFLLQGESSSDSLSDVSVRPVRCRLFVQKVKDGPIWSNLKSEPILATVEKQNEKYLVTFEGKVMESVNQSQVMASGKLESVEY